MTKAFVDLTDVTIHFPGLSLVHHGEVTVRALKAVVSVLGLNMVRILSHAGECHILAMAVEAKVPGKQLLSFRIF